MRNKILKIIGANIRKFRRLNELTQEDLAKKLKTSRVSVVNIEKGKQGIPLYKIPLLCKILDCTPTSLFK